MFDRKTWYDNPSGGTPTSADALNDLEGRIASALGGGGGGGGGGSFPFVADGVANDSAVMNDALAWLSAGGRTLQLPDGIINLPDELVPITGADSAIVASPATVLRLPAGTTGVGDLLKIQAARFKLLGFPRLLNAELVAPAVGYPFVLDGAVDCYFEASVAGFAGMANVGETTRSQRCRFFVEGGWNADLGQPAILEHKAINMEYHGSLNGVGTRHVVPRGMIEMRPGDTSPDWGGMDTSRFSVTLQYIPAATVATTVAPASNGVALPAATIHVDDASDPNFPSSGKVRLTLPEGRTVVQYTDKQANGDGTWRLTGCTAGDGTLTSGAPCSSIWPYAEGYWYNTALIVDGSATEVNQWLSGSTLDHCTAAGLAVIVDGSAYVRHLHAEDMRISADPQLSGGPAVLVAHNSPQALEALSIGGSLNIAGRYGAVLSGGNDLQQVLVKGDSGSYKLHVPISGGADTVAISGDPDTATPAAVEAAIAGALTAINPAWGAPEVRVFGGPPGVVDESTFPPVYNASPYHVLFCGKLANQPVSLLTADDTNLNASDGTAAVTVTRLAAGQADDTVKSIDLHTHFVDTLPSSSDVQPAAILLAAEHCTIDSSLEYGGVDVGFRDSFVDVVKDIGSMKIDSKQPCEYVGPSRIKHYPYAVNDDRRIVVPGGGDVMGAQFGACWTNPASVAMSAGDMRVVRAPYLPNVRVLTGIRVKSGAGAPTGHVIVAYWDHDGKLLGVSAALLLSGAQTVESVPFAAPVVAGPGRGYIGCANDQADNMIASDTLWGARLVAGGYASVPDPLTIPTTTGTVVPEMSLF